MKRNKPDGGQKWEKTGVKLACKQNLFYNKDDSKKHPIAQLWFLPNAVHPNHPIL